MQFLKDGAQTVVIFLCVVYYLSLLMGKQTICIGKKTKAQISFAVTAKLISVFVFATRIVQFLFYLNQKFQASSSFLCLYRPVCVGPVRKPHCWFSHEVAHLVMFILSLGLKFEPVHEQTNNLFF